MQQQYLEVNKRLWNNKVAHHVDSDFYDTKGFLAGASSLKSIELGLLGDVKGRSILHLQCHFGQDTLSLARMGAVVTEVDFSDAAIDKARELAAQLDLSGTASFLCTDIYSLPEVLDQTFDIVFTSYGTIGWLPDMSRWADVVARFLKPGGRFVFVDFHPVVWMFDNEFTHVAYSYFNDGPIIETQSGTYADRDAPIADQEIGWNHSLTEVLTALLAIGLNLRHFGEYNYSPFNCFRGMIESSPGVYHILSQGDKLPMVYSLVLEKQ